jgi:hypothetical protein
MAVQRQRFTEAQPIVIPDPEPVDPTSFWEKEWAKRNGEVRFWQRARRTRLRAEVTEHAHRQAADAFAHARDEHRKQQAVADGWWDALTRGESSVLIAALNAAFADNPAPAIVVEASGSDAVVALALPGEAVLPEKQAHVTPTGRLSSKAWTKTEFNKVYAELLGAHLLATIREAWSVAPSLDHLRVIGFRDDDQSSPPDLPEESGARLGDPDSMPSRVAEALREVARALDSRTAVVGVEIVFDVDVSRTDGEWDDDGWGDVVLDRAPLGLNLLGRAHEVHAWPRAQLRVDTIELLDRA